MQKARGHFTQKLPPLVSGWFQVLFHSPVRGSFHLSLTVLVHYRSSGTIQPWQMVLPYSLRIPRVPSYSGNPPPLYPFTRTGLSPLLSTLSIVCSAYDKSDYVAPHPPNAVTSKVWARTSSIASTKVFTFCFLFLRLLRCFSSPGSLLSQKGSTLLTYWVAPFRNLRLKVYLQLPVTYRSLSRLSSPPEAQASAIRPQSLSSSK